MPLSKTTIRLDPELLAITRAEAKRLGIDWSEYVRQALAYRVAWSTAMRTAAEGALVDLDQAQLDAIAASLIRQLAEAE